MKKIIPLLLFIVGLFIFASVGAVDNSQLPLLNQTNLKYLGAFRVPDGSFAMGGFDYGGTAIAYNPTNNSLFAVGHNYYQLTSEISIPTAVNSTTSDINALNKSTVLQNFFDTTEGNRCNIGLNGIALDTSGCLIGGLLPYNGKLIGTIYGYYDASSVVKSSHFVSGLNLSTTGDFKGVYKVGNLNPAFVGGYMGNIPAEWQASFGGPVLTGNCCLSIIGRTSLGPAASVFDPDRLGIDNPVTATPVVGYPLDHPTLGTYGDQDPNHLFNGSMGVGGVVFPKGTRTVLFFGDRGKGQFCYGEGKSDPALHMTHCDPHYPDVFCCYDPTSESKGGHSYPYVYSVFAYDAMDLLAVKNGQKQQWEITPYAVWELNFPFAQQRARIAGAAYDPVTQRIYISEYGGERIGYGFRPIIQVYQVDINGTNPQSTRYYLSDFLVLVSNWLKTVVSNADVNSDGAVNVKDLGKMMSSWN